MERQLTHEQMRVLMDAAQETIVRRFGELLASGALDGIDLSSPEGKTEVQRLVGLEQPTHADVRRWVHEGWFDALAEDN